jgi:hypothetical protein
MKKVTPTKSESAEILVWESSFLSLTEDQKSLCVALHRNAGPMHEDELVSCLNCTVDELRKTKSGIFGILIDASTRNYWIK